MFKLKLPKATPDDPASLLELERSLDLERRTKEEEMRQAEIAAGDALLQSVFEGAQEVDVPLSSADGVASQLRTLQNSIAAVRQRRINAVREKYQSQSQAFREEADQKRRQVDKLQQQSVKLLARLSEIEGVPFTQAILHAQPSDTGWFTYGSRSLDLCMPSERVAVDHTAAFQIPLSRKLIDEASALEDQATLVSGKTARIGGVINASDEEHLFAELYSDAETIAPTAEIVESWIHQCEQILKREHPSLANVSRAFHLEWTADGIDFFGSRMTVGGLHFAPQN